MNPRYKQISNGRQLRVTNAQLTDSAEFSCKVRNKAGNDQVFFDLEVLGNLLNVQVLKGTLSLQSLMYTYIYMYICLVCFLIITTAIFTNIIHYININFLAYNSGEDLHNY